MEMQDRPLEGVSRVAYDVLLAGCVLPQQAYPDELVMAVAEAINQTRPSEAARDDYWEFVREQAYAALDAVARFLR